MHIPNAHLPAAIYGTFVQNVHSSKTMSSMSGFTSVDSIRGTQKFVTPNGIHII
jgi:hypothetical protein